MQLKFPSLTFLILGLLCGVALSACDPQTAYDSDQQHCNGQYDRAPEQAACATARFQFARYLVMEHQHTPQADLPSPAWVQDHCAQRCTPLYSDLPALQQVCKRSCAQAVEQWRMNAYGPPSLFQVL